MKSMSTMASLSMSAKLKRLFVDEGTSSLETRQRELSPLIGSSFETERTSSSYDTSCSLLR